jgi:tetratricopeptide (TPR) repeat protein
MSISSGIILDFTDSFCVLAGLELKGGNPRISLGSEFDVKKVKMNVNYTLDLTTSFNPINRISFSAKLLLGDKGRSLEQEQIDLLYASGLMYYNKSQWQEAINEWEKILEIDKRYDPAIKGIKSAKTQLDIYNDVYENMFLSL